MPRKPRLDSPGLLQHVIVRGIERRDIFLDDEDRRGFLARLSRLFQETGTDCFAWALIPNHGHLLLRCRQVTLPRFMRRLLTGYAVTFNRRHNRSGHLFQNRYKSIVCQEDSYLLELIRYIHLNPLRAGLVENLSELESYPWCGHATLLNRRPFGGQAQGEVLAYFDKRNSVARQRYRQFVADGVAMGRRPELVGEDLRMERTDETGTDEIGEYDDRILGDGDFVRHLRQQKELQERLPPRVELPDLQAKVSALFGLAPEAIIRRGRANAVSEARAVLCYWATVKMGVPGSRVGTLLGMGSSSIVGARGRS